MFTDCINVMDNGSGFQAFIPSKPSFCGYGDTKTEAIGKLVIQLQDYKILDLTSTATSISVECGTQKELDRLERVY